MRRKYRKLKRLSIHTKISTATNMGKQDCNILSFGYVEAAHFIFDLTNNAAVNSNMMRTKKRLQSISLILSEDHK